MLPTQLQDKTLRRPSSSMSLLAKQATASKEVFMRGVWSKSEYTEHCLALESMVLILVYINTQHHFQPVSKRYGTQVLGVL